MQNTVDYVCSESDRENKRVFLGMIQPLGGTMADLGCGGGQFTAEIARRAKALHVYGVERSTPKARAAQKKGVIVSQVDLNGPLPFEDNFFETVTANQVIEHLYWTDNFIKEIKRVTKVNGQIILSTTNLAALHYRLQLLVGQQPICLHPAQRQFGNFLRGEKNPYFGHKSLFTYKAFLEFIRFHRLEIEASRAVHLFPLPSLLSNPILKIFPNWGVFTTVRARKIGR